MRTETILGLVLALLTGAATFAYGGFELSPSHPFIADLSYVIVIGCVLGSLLVGILSPPKSAGQQAAFPPIDTTITPQYLVDLFKGRTDLQGENLVKEHLGKEMTVSGLIDRIALLGSGPKLSVSIEHKPGILAFFEKDWKDRLIVLRKGDQICVTGKIDSVSGTIISLESCKIVSVGKER